MKGEARYANEKEQTCKTHNSFGDVHGAVGNLYAVDDCQCRRHI